MALDSWLLKKAAATPHSQIVRTRTSDSDYVEAKANIVAKRILDSNPVEEMIEELEDEESVEDELNGHEVEEDEAGSPIVRFELPPEDQSGLITPGFEPDESQIEAVKTLLHEQYGCLIGAAGSGKTTTLRRLLHYVIYGNEELGVKPHPIRQLSTKKQGLSIALCAFTGIATQVIKQNMPDWLHPACKTIHMLLEYMPVDSEITDKKTGELRTVKVFMPTRDRHNKLDVDLIVLDEASMVGVDLWHQLLDACRPGTRIILIGDLNQLPPVMSQSMFAYALSEWKVSELLHIHRQKEAAANKIVEAAHMILNGEIDKFLHSFDDPTKNPNWRVIGFELASDPLKAGAQIVSIANQLRTRKVHESIDPEQPLIYDPYRDRIITAGNGLNDNDTSSVVQQRPINEALSRLIQPPTKENPIILIDAGLSKKKFAVGHRVMATKNESPDIEDRVTNGMVGVIREINRNAAWDGNPLFVGPEDEVQENRKEMLTGKLEFNPDADGMDDFSFGMESRDKGKDREGGGPASHSIVVEFANKAVRVFNSKSQVDSLFLAYASTCHKCQGSQFDTAIIVVHHVAKAQLSREWLYTAVTRAQKRVVLLYTKHGVRNAIANQRIFGRTLEEKIDKYKRMQEKDGALFKGRVRLSIEERSE